MRDNIYYWKCDSPTSTDEKKQSYFKEKYDRKEITETVTAACVDIFGSDGLAVEPLRADGNHITYIISHNNRKYLFRADDGSGDDEYMLAESALMRLAGDSGVPVPAITRTDVSRKNCPYRFQIMDYLTEPSLNTHHKAGTLNSAEIAFQLGCVLRKIHNIHIDGFGFINTDLLADTGEIKGIDKSYSDYFHKRLDDHIGYLRHTELLSISECDEIMRQFKRHSPRFNLPHGVLVHRDMALWNVLGTPDKVTAVIDWDDAVSGDPADDLGILRCFYDEEFMTSVTRGYCGDAVLSDDFNCRIWIHNLRNMLWKTKIRHSLGYFDKDSDFFLNTPDVHCTLKEHTLNLLRTALDKVRSFNTP